MQQNVALAVIACVRAVQRSQILRTLILHIAQRKLSLWLLEGCRELAKSSSSYLAHLLISNTMKSSRCDRLCDSCRASEHCAPPVGTSADITQKKNSSRCVIESSVGKSAPRLRMGAKGGELPSTAMQRLIVIRHHPTRGYR